MTPVRNYIGLHKVYIGLFLCDTCGQKLEKHPFTFDDMTIYCDCGEKDAMRLGDVKLKIPVTIIDNNGKAHLYRKN